MAYRRISWHDRAFEMKTECLSYLSTITSWNHVTSFEMIGQLDFCLLRLLFSKMVHLRNLIVHHYFTTPPDIQSKREYLTNMFTDTSLCETLMSNGLEKLRLYNNSKYPSVKDIASAIVKGLDYLQIIEWRFDVEQIPEVLEIFLNGLSKSSLLIFHVDRQPAIQLLPKIEALQKLSKRTFRIDYCESSFAYERLYIWMSE